MKKSIILLCLVVVLGGCDFMKSSANDLHPEKTYEIKTIDSCEYIYVSRRPYGGDFSLAHKGNCKYCIERSK